MRRKQSIAVLLSFILAMTACMSINGISAQAQSSIASEEILDYEENILTDEEINEECVDTGEETQEILQDIEQDIKGETKEEAGAVTEAGITEEVRDESAEEAGKPGRILQDGSVETGKETGKPDESSVPEKAQETEHSEVNQTENADETLEERDTAVTVTEEPTMASSDHIHAKDGGNILFTAWTDAEAASQYGNNARTSSDSLPIQEGNWFLEKDVNLTGTWAVPVGTTNLCLNGHSITMDSDGEALLIGENAALILSDCENAQGLVTHASGKTGSGVKLSGGSFTLDGGRISGNTLTGDKIGGGVYVMTGDFVMNGGLISGNTVEAGGGGVVVSTGCSFVMTGGAISGNTAYNGSGVYAYKASVKMTGGSITGNICKKGNGGLFLNEGSTLLLSGSPEISKNQTEKDENKTEENLVLRKSLVTIDGKLANDNPIGVLLLDEGWNRPEGLFTDSSASSIKASAYLERFTSDNPLYNVQAEGDELKLAIPLHTHGEGSEAVTFRLWTDAEAASQYGDSGKTASNSLPNKEGLWYLSKDVVLTEAWNVPVGTTDLCLNGRTIKRESDGAAVYIGADAVLNLFNCIDRQGTITHVSGKDGCGVEVAAGAFTMNGGVIAGNSSESGGGGVLITGGRFVLHDGCIRDNVSGNGVGAGVYVKKGSFDMNSGVISNNTAQNGGGGVFAASACTFTMTGGNINENNAYNGSGVYAYNCTFTLSGGSITGNTCNGGDGGVFVNDGGTLLLSGNPGITGNRKNKNGSSIDDDLALRDSFVTITGALAFKTPVSVRVLDKEWNQPEAVFTTGSSASVKASDYKDMFRSGNPAYTVQTEGAELKLAVPPHIHSFTYSSKGNTITAKCVGSGKCDLAQGLNLTVAAPSGLTYNGKGKAASLNADYSKSAFPSQYVIMYTGRDGTVYGPTSAAPVNAGKYTAQVKAENADASVNFVISKASRKAPSAPAAAKVTGYSIQVSTKAGQEYRISGRKTWQKSGLFTGLKSGKSYTVVTRRAADKNHTASSSSAGTKVKTLSASMLLGEGFKAKETGKKITVSYGKVSGAGSYEIYAQYCQYDGFSKKPAAVIAANKKTPVTITRINGKAIKTNAPYKVFVVARKGKTELGRTVVAFCAGSTGKYTDAGKITLSKNTYSLQTGKTAAIRASLSLADKSKKELPKKYAGRLRYRSSDTSVATVNKSGLITAKKAGICTVYVTARNGLTKSVSVKVK